MSEQFDKYGSNTVYWTLTPYSALIVRSVNYDGDGNYNGPAASFGSRPSMNLKSTVKIVSGKGTKSSPFVLSGN